MKTCIAYFSKSGNTKNAAEHLAGKIGAEVIALDDKTNYKGVVGFLKGGMRASFRQKAALDGAVYRKISAFDRIVLATPIWAGKTTPAINAVLANVDFQGKEVYVVTTQADPACKDSQARREFYHKAVEERGGRFVKLFSLYGSPPGTAALREDMAARVDAAVDIEP